MNKKNPALLAAAHRNAYTRQYLNQPRSSLLPIPHYERRDTCVMVNIFIRRPKKSTVTSSLQNDYAIIGMGNIIRQFDLSLIGLHTQSIFMPQQQQQQFRENITKLRNGMVRVMTTIKPIRLAAAHRNKYTRQYLNQPRSPLLPMLGGRVVRVCNKKPSVTFKEFADAIANQIEESINE